MFIDHAGKMFFPKLIVLRIIGRLAFPVFAYSLAMGIIYTRDDVKYLSRVVLLALISQPLSALGLAHENARMYSVPLFPNPFLSIYTFYINSWDYPCVLMTLSLALAILVALRHKNFILAIGLYMLCEHFSTSYDYGINGIRLVLLFYFFAEHPPLMALAAGGFLVWWSSHGQSYTFFGHTFSMEIYALPSLLLCTIPMKRTFRLPRLVTYGFYPAHLALLALLVKL